MISGAGGVLGRAFIKRLLADGHKIFASEINSSMVDSLNKSFSKSEMFYCSKCDVTSEKEVKDWFAELTKETDIDVVINNASITSEYLKKIDELPLSFEETSLKSWEESLNVNLTGSFLIARELGKHAKSCGKKNLKKLINLASMYALHGPDHRIYEGTSIKTFAAYSTTKSGIVGLTRWLSTYWADHNITVNALAPGAVFNGHEEIFKSRIESKIPLSKMADKAQIASVMSFLVSDDSNYMTGQLIYADGGYTIT